MEKAGKLYCGQCGQEVILSGPNDNRHEFVGYVIPGNADFYHRTESCFKRVLEQRNALIRLVFRRSHDVARV